MWGSSGNLGQDMRRPGPREGTSVHVQQMWTFTVLPQANPSVFTERLTSGAGSHPFWHLGVLKGEVPFIAVPQEHQRTFVDYSKV